MGLAPHGADGLDWFDGMAQSNVIEFTAAANGYEDIAAHTKAVAEEVRANPASLLATLQAELPDPDRRVVADQGIRSMLIESYAEALRTSDYGWIDDVLAFCSPWGFDPATVRVPVLLWHGASDVFSPASHARWLADQIPSAAVVVQAGAAHFGALDVLPDILRWLSAGPMPADPVIAGSGPGLADRTGPMAAQRASDLLRFQVAVDPLPLVQLGGVRVARPQDAAEVSQDRGPELLGLRPGPPAQRDGQVGLADQRVRMVPPSVSRSRAMVSRSSASAARASPESPRQLARLTAQDRVSGCVSPSVAPHPAPACPRPARAPPAAGRCSGGSTRDCWRRPGCSGDPRPGWPGARP